MLTYIKSDYEFHPKKGKRRRGQGGIAPLPTPKGKITGNIHVNYEYNFRPQGSLPPTPILSTFYLPINNVIQLHLVENKHYIKCESFAFH